MSDFCNPLDYSQTGSSIQGILQTRILKWVAVPFSRGYFQPRDGTYVSCIASRFFTIWVTREALFSLTLNFAIRNWWSEPQYAPRSCFCWFYTASPSPTTKNVINLISMLTIWWCPCIKLSLELLKRECLLWSVCSLGRILLAFALLHSVLQGQICLLLEVFLDFLFLHSSPL